MQWLLASWPCLSDETLNLSLTQLPAGRALCTHRGSSPLLDRALRLMKPRLFPHGIDSHWVHRNVYAEADAAANAGLRVRVEKRRI